MRARGTLAARRASFIRGRSALIDRDGEPTIALELRVSKICPRASATATVMFCIPKWMPR